MKKIALAALLLLSAALASNINVTKELVKCSAIANCTGVPTTTLYAVKGDYVYVLITVTNDGTDTVGGIVWDSAPQEFVYQNRTIATDADVPLNLTGVFANTTEASNAATIAGIPSYFPTQVVSQTEVPKFPEANRVIAWGLNPQGFYQFVPIPPGYNKSFSYFVNISATDIYSLGRAYFVTELVGMEITPGFYETTFCSYPGGSALQEFSIRSLAANLTNVLVSVSQVSIGGSPTDYVSFNASPTFFASIPAGTLRTFTGTVSVTPGTPSSTDSNPYTAVIYVSSEQIPASTPVPIYIRVKDCGIPVQTLEPSIVTNPRNVTVRAYPPENRTLPFRTVNKGTAQGKVLVSPACGGVASPASFFIEPGQVRNTEVAYNLATPTNCSGNVTFTLRDAADTMTLQTENLPINITSYSPAAGASILFVNCTSGDPFPPAYNFSVSRAKSETVFCANNDGNITLTDIQLVPSSPSLPTAVRWSTDGSNYSDAIASLPTANTLYIKLITDGQDSLPGAYNVTYKILANGAKDTIDSTVSLASVPDVTLSPASISPLQCSQMVTITKQAGNDITDLTVTPYGNISGYLDIYPRHTKAYLGSTAASINLTFDSYRCELANCSGTLAGGLNVTYDGKAFAIPISLPNPQGIDCAVNNTNAVATVLSNAYLSRGEAGYVLKTPAAVQTIDQNNGTMLYVTFSGSSLKNVTVFLNGYELGSVQMNGTQALEVSDKSIIAYAGNATNVVSLKSYEDISTINVNATNVTLLFNVSTPVFYITPKGLFLTMAPGGTLQQDFTLGNAGRGTVSAITLSLTTGNPGDWITIPSTMPNLEAGQTEAFTMAINVPNNTELINRTFKGGMHVRSRVGTIEVPIWITVREGVNITVIAYDEDTNVTLENMNVYILSAPRRVPKHPMDPGIYQEVLETKYIGEVHTIEVTDPNAEYVPVRTSFAISAGDNVIRMPMRKGKILSVSVSSPFCSDYELSTGSCILSRGENYTITVSATLPQLEYTVKYGFEVIATATREPSPGVYETTISVGPTGSSGNTGSPPGPGGGDGGDGGDGGGWTGDCNTINYLYQWLAPNLYNVLCGGGGGVPLGCGGCEWISFPPTNPERPDPSQPQAPPTELSQIYIQREGGVPPAPAPAVYVTGFIREAYKQISYVLVNSNVIVTASAYVDIPGESTVIAVGVTNGNDQYNASRNFSFLDPTVTFSARFCGANSTGACINKSAPLMPVDNITLGSSCTTNLCLIDLPFTKPIGRVENITVVANSSTELHRVIHAQQNSGVSATVQVGYNATLGYYGIYARANATLNNANLTGYTEEGYTLIRVVRPPYLVASVSAPYIEQGQIVKQGEFFTLRATVTNDGDKTARSVTASLSRLDNLEVIGANVKSLGDLPSGGSATVEWVLRATKRAVALLAEMRAVSLEGATGLALWAGVSQANVDLALDPNYWDWGRLTQCGSASKQFYMHNNGDIDLSVNYRRVIGYASTWISSTPSSFYIPASGYTLITLTVTIPCDIGPGHYEGIFEFVGTGRTLLLAPLRFGGEVVSDKAQLSEMTPKPKEDRLLLSTSNISCSNVSTSQNCSAGFDVGGASTSISPLSADMTAANGISGNATLSITNKNLVLPSVNISFHSPAGWLSFEPANLTIPQNATMNFVVKAALPRGTAPGTYYSPIYAIYNGTRDSYSNINVRVPVLASVSPSSIPMGDMLPGTSKRFALNVSNPSTVIVEASLQASDWLAYDAASLVLYPGDTIAANGLFSVPPGTSPGSRIVPATVIVGGQPYQVPITVNVLEKYVRQAFDSGISTYSRAYLLTQCASASLTVYARSNPPAFFTEPSTAYLTIVPATATPIQTSWFNTTTLNLSVPPSPGIGNESIAISIPCNAPSGTFYGIITGYASNGSSTYSFNQLYFTIAIPTDLLISPTQIATSFTDGDIWSGNIIQVRNTNPTFAFESLAMRFFTSGSNPIDPAWFTSLSDGLSVPPSSPGTLLPVAIQIPTSQQPGTYTGLMRLSGTFQGNLRYFDIPVMLAVHPKMTISAASFSMTITDGNAGAASLTIYNNGITGNLTDVTLSPATGYGTLPMPSSWVTPSANNFNIVDGGSRPVTITIAVPLVTPGGTYTSYVNVTDSIGRRNTFTLSVTVPARFTGITSQSVSAYDGETSSTAYASFGVATVDAGFTCATVYVRKTGAAAPFIIIQDEAWVTGKCVPIGYYSVPFRVSVPAGTAAGTYTGALTIVTSTGVNYDMSVTVNVPQAVAASVLPTVATVQPGNVQQINVTVTNNYYPSAVASINGTVDASGPVAAWLDNTSKPFPNITSNYPYPFSTTVSFAALVPSTQDPGSYTGTFTANSRQSFAVSTTINVPAVITVNITSISATVYDAVPFTRDFSITDLNIQNTAVNLAVTGLDASLYSLNETSFVMDKGQVRTVRLTFSAPNQYPSAVYSGKLRLVESAAGKVIEIPLNFTLNNSLSMTPARIFSEQVPDVPVVSQYPLRNNANTPLAVTLTLEPTTSSPLNLSWATGYNVTTTIPAGGTYTHNITVTLPGDAIGYFTGRVKLTTSQGHTRISELIVKSAIDMVMDVC